MNVPRQEMKYSGQFLIKHVVLGSVVMTPQTEPKHKDNAWMSNWWLAAVQLRTLALIYSFHLIVLLSKRLQMTSRCKDSIASIPNILASCTYRCGLLYLGP